MLSIKELIKKHEIRYIDFRYTDTLGKWLHITYEIEAGYEVLYQGMLTDGSSIKGWCNVDDSDLIMLPDPNTAFIDPFSPEPTLIIICDVIDPKNNTPYERDPRSTAKKAANYLLSQNLGTAFFGPELEFFIFDDIKYSTSTDKSFVHLDSAESPLNSDRAYTTGNTGHRPDHGGGYLISQPGDVSHHIRNVMLKKLKDVGLVPIMHHHEVAPSQSEIGFKYGELIDTADNVQKYKYVIRNVAHKYGKTATFMPKPLKDENGSGMHVHQSIWKENQPLFLGKNYANLSEMALYYIGGIIRHAKAINAFANPSTNSYKRLVPGFEAPTFLCYSARNRSAAIRIPHTLNEEAKRIEVRFPDPSSNPYLAFSAMLMAGIDGIKNKIHPGEAIELNLFEANENQTKKLPRISGSLRESLEALNIDRTFLINGNVFTNEQIDAYIELKMDEVNAIESSPHPYEFKLYYSS